MLLLGLHMQVAYLRSLVWNWRMWTEDYLWDTQIALQDQLWESQVEQAGGMQEAGTHVVPQQQEEAAPSFTGGQGGRASIQELVQRPAPKMQYSVQQPMAPHGEHTATVYHAPHDEVWEQMQIIKGRISPLRASTEGLAPSPPRIVTVEAQMSPTSPTSAISSLIRSSGRAYSHEATQLNQVEYM